MLKILGHRGCAGLEPENTIRAFKRALDLGVDLIEFDVRMTKDKKLIIIHDSTVNRTTDGKGYVRDFSFREIRKLNAGKNEKIPSLKEALDFLKNEKVIIVIEIKESDSWRKILEIIKKKKLENKVIIISFFPEPLKKIKEVAPEIKTGLILAIKLPNFILIKAMKKIKSEFLCLYQRLVNEKIVKDCRQNNIIINVWTVNKLEDIKRMIKLKVDIITSDYPDRVLKLKEKAKLT